MLAENQRTKETRRLARLGRPRWSAASTLGTPLRQNSERLAREATNPYGSAAKGARITPPFYGNDPIARFVNSLATQKSNTKLCVKCGLVIRL